MNGALTLQEPIANTLGSARTTPCIPEAPNCKPLNQEQKPMKFKNGYRILKALPLKFQILVVTVQCHIIK